MPTDDYSAAVSGGLKLKGVNSSSKISKHRRKKPKADTNPTDSVDKAQEEGKPKESFNHGTPDEPSEQAIVEDATEVSSPPPPPQTGKTEAEIRHEERRRKRLDERLKREGTKTHKERVEELNRYLSNLSEHHDMPRIGPG